MSAIAAALFEGRESAKAAYELLVPVLQQLGDYKVEEKKTSLHITNGEGAFLGVHPRKNVIRVNIVLSRGLDSDRVVKVEQVSARRFHNELDVSAGDKIDDELVGWIREAYARNRNSPI